MSPFNLITSTPPAAPKTATALLESASRPESSGVCFEDAVEEALAAQDPQVFEDTPNDESAHTVLEETAEVPNALLASAPPAPPNSASHATLPTTPAANDARPLWKAEALSGSSPLLPPAWTASTPATPHATAPALPEQVLSPLTRGEHAVPTPQSIPLISDARSAASPVHAVNPQTPEAPAVASPGIPTAPTAPSATSLTTPTVPSETAEAKPEETARTKSPVVPLAAADSPPRSDRARLRASTSAMAPPPEPAAPPAGTPGAQQQMSMKKPSKVNEISGPAQQNLPGGDVLTGREILPGKSDRAALTEPAAAPVAPTTKTGTSAETAPASSPSSTALRSLERTTDLIAFHAFRLRDANDSSMRVVIKPGGGLQLSLDIRQDDGGVQVRALLNRGDFNFLSHHWSDLQQHLEARGVRLAPLVNQEQHASNQSSHHNQQRSQRDEDGFETFGDFDFTGTETRLVRPARAGSRSAGWEGWA